MTKKDTSVASPGKHIIRIVTPITIVIMSSLVENIFGAKSKSSNETKNSTTTDVSVFDTPAIEIPKRPASDFLPRIRTNPKRPSSHTTATINTEPMKKRRKPPKQDTLTSTTTTPSLGDVNKDPTTNGEEVLPEVDNVQNLVDARTIFVGNMPLHYDRKALHKVFVECGKIESTRIRSVAVVGVKLPPSAAGNQRMVKKVCANTGRLDDDAKQSVSGYVVFTEAASVEKALQLNGTSIKDDQSTRHIRVDRCRTTHDPARTVFVGNLTYQADEESLAQHFAAKLGTRKSSPEEDRHTDDAFSNLIEAVRIVRDPETHQCKGFGYVLFRERSTVAEAIRLVHETTYLRRPLRVQVCGKRFKQKKNESPEANNTAVGALRRVLSKPTPRKRSTHKVKNSKSGSTGGGGMSKRATAQAKVGKRVKKIEKRLSKGMGKTRRS